MVLQFSSWGSKSETDILKPILSDFEKENPDIKIDFMHIPQNYFQKIHLLLASNTAPDVIFINNLYLPLYANHLEKLEIPEKFYPQALNALSWDGNLYAIPRDISNLVIYYNKNMFDKKDIKYPSQDWRNGWDCAIFFGSFIPALLWGVAVTNLLQGLPINAQMHYLGHFSDLLSPYTVVGGLTFVFVFIFHGAAFLSLKLGDEGMLLELRRSSIKFGLIAAVLYVLMIGMTLTSTDVLATKGFGGVSLFASGALCFLIAIKSMYDGRAFSSFVFTTMAIASTVVQFFIALFPRLMVSSLNPEWSLTIYNAASTPHTLMIMTGAAVVMVPVVLIYQAWTYRLFRERITRADLKH